LDVAVTPADAREGVAVIASTFRDDGAGTRADPMRAELSYAPVPPSARTVLVMVGPPGWWDPPATSTDAPDFTNLSVELTTERASRVQAHVASTRGGSTLTVAAAVDALPPGPATTVTLDRGASTVDYAGAPVDRISVAVTESQGLVPPQRE
jgi:hypothetical protein